LRDIAGSAAGVPTVIYPCSVRPIPFTVPTFPSSTPGHRQPPGRHGAAQQRDLASGNPSYRVGATADYVGVDNYRRADVHHTDHRGEYSVPARAVFVRLKFHGSSFLVHRRSVLVTYSREDVAYMSRENRACRTRMLRGRCFRGIEALLIATDLSVR